MRQHERRDAPRAALEEGPIAVEHHADAADPGAEHHAEAVDVDLAVDEAVVAQHAGVTQRLAGGGHREVRVAIVAPHVLGVHVPGRVESLHLAGDANVERLGVEEGDVGDA